MSWWKKGIIGLLVIVLLLMTTVALLIGTTSGLHLLFKGANRWVPGLHISQVQGGWRDLNLRDITYQMQGVEVRGGQLHLAVNTSCLWHSSVCVDDLSLSDVSVVVDTRKMAPSTPVEETKSEPLTDISTPYPLTLKHLGLHNINVKVDDTRIALGEFSTGIAWQNRQITLAPTQINNFLLALPTVAQVAVDHAAQATKTAMTQTAEQVSQQKKAEDEQARIAAQQPPLGDTLRAMFAKPLLDLPSVTLPVDVDIQGITGNSLRVTGDTELTINQLNLKARALNNHIALQQLQVQAIQGQLHASGEADLTDNWPVNLNLNSTVNVDSIKGQKVKLSLKGNMKQQVDLAVNLSGPVKAQLNAMAQPATVGLPFSLKLNSPRLRWPLTGPAQVQVDNVNLDTSGKASDYRIQLAAALTGQGIPPAQISLKGKGDLGQFSLDRLRVAALQGNVDLNALVDWNKAISWHSDLTLNNINTARQYPDWPAKINGQVTTKGSLFGGTWQLSVPKVDIKGNVKQNPVNIEGSLQGNSYMQWKVPQLLVALGRNHLNVHGELNDKLMLDADIDAPALDNALPGLGGTMKGVINARGTLQQPELKVDLQGRALRWQQIRLQSLALKGNVSSAEQISGNLVLNLQQLHQEGVDINQILLNAGGNEQAHQLTLKVTGKPVAGELALKGHFDRQQQRWQGSLTRSQFSTPVGNVTLSRAMSLDYQNTKQTITVGSHCWVNPNAELCVPEPIVAGPDGHAHLQIRRLDLAMLKDFLPAQTQLSGRFSGDTRVNWTAKGGLPEAKLSLSGQGVEVRQDVQGKMLPIAFDRLDVKAALVKGKAQLQWLIKLVNNGQLTGNVQIADPENRRTLGGTVGIDNLSLAMLNPALSKGESVQGVLSSQLRLGGSLQNPQVFGQLALKNAKALTSAMPVELTDANLSMVFNGMSSTLEGLIQTAHGNLNLSGNADWRQLDNWHAHIAAKGEKIRVTVPPMVRMDVSPDLTFDATPTAFNLDGRVDIPWARIVVQDVPESAVGVSSDEVMLDEHLQPIKPTTTGMAINSNLIIHVGDDVKLSAFGLNARLNGDLKVGQGKNGLGLNGQINIPSGRFHAYGQDLIVRKGQLQFSGPPDQPYVNLEAIRNPDATEDNVTAGIRVTGLADEPKVEVFSDPAMSQQAALSYLLRGQGLGSSDDSNALTSALVGLGVAQSGQVMGKIGETFGVSNLALDTAGVGDSQQVQVSGYVLPGLQVKYGVGLFDSLATLTLRYRLMPKLYLEAVSGVDQALDVLYKFEF
ncbi:translocation/assembly module TamB [Rosenbergiella sp. S61]|uniref:Translocation/assembly module TamB n=1 Tax=Rosenbergiella gaditana TaxID=2726987 RepID=A0ABS5SXD6_9GAMM|nr:translocation/assembly module TamB domain-containing protein [Rosenbergiella gaditana]MBT0724158.1 translocation/assembly module TamB [Rosenbergiella gaditana]